MMLMPPSSSSLHHNSYSKDPPTLMIRTGVKGRLPFNGVPEICLTVRIYFTPVRVLRVVKKISSQFNVSVKLNFLDLIVLASSFYYTCTVCNPLFVPPLLLLTMNYSFFCLFSLCCSVLKIH